ncbi:MAG: C25 family cysteine peptidase [Bacteroidota bacterium]
MKKLQILFWITSCFSTCFFSSSAQINYNGETRFGNEWIDYDQTYFKIGVSRDGIYRISYQELLAAGVYNATDVPLGADFKMYHEGKEVPLFVSNNGTFSDDDFIEFFGQRNTGWLDQFLYDNPDKQLNPYYSMYSDTSMYFLTWSDERPSNRMTTLENDLINLPEKEEYCIRTANLNYNNTYQQGFRYTGRSESISSLYDTGEGFSKNTFTNSQSQRIETPQVENNEVKAMIQTRIVTRNGQHDFSIQLNGNEFLQENFGGWVVKEFEFEAEPTALRNNNEIKIEGSDEANDRFNWVHTSIQYPATFDFENLSQVRFKLPASSFGQYIEIQNFRHNGSEAILYDLSNNRRIIPEINNDLLRIYLPAAANESDLLLVAAESISAVDKISERTFEVFDFENESFDYILLSHPRLINDANGYVQEYVDYRASSAGGSFSAVTVDVTQLYDQFGYGVARHEVGIKNFLTLAHNNWNVKYLFLLGKGESRVRIRKGNPDQRYNLLPSYGFPDSDYLFSVGEDLDQPRFAVGRVAAYTAEHVRIYLEKIKEHEAVFQNAQQNLTDKAWTKRVLHFAGGDAGIQSSIRNTLNNLKNELDNSLFGSNTVVFAKGSTSTVSDTPESVDNLINDGTSMLTFFGHSAPTTLDFNLDPPENYNNKGKYPFFYAIGCNTNTVISNTITLSEEWVLVEDKGAIGFFGSTWTTQLSPLSNYANVFYENLGTDNYGERLGDVIKATMEEFGRFGGFTNQQAKQLLMLHGDPAIQMYSYAQPDYLINEEESIISPSIVDLQSDSFKLELVIQNIGKHIEDSLDVLIEHSLADGSIQKLAAFEIPAPDFREVININLPLSSKDSIATGKNELKITLDANNSLEEGPSGAENNNISVLSFFTARSDINPVFPEDFAIVNSDKIALKASTTDAFSRSFQYFIEIDTTEDFNSAFRRTDIIEQIGGLIEWQIPFRLEEEQVYYWRIGIDNEVTGSAEIVWKSRSFTYLENSASEGWNQGHYHQFEKNTYENLALEENSDNLVLADRTKSIEVINSTPASLNWGEMAVFENGFRSSSFNNFPCQNGFPIERINMVIYDGERLNVDAREPVPNCWGWAVDWHMFDPKLAEDRLKWMNTIDAIDDGDYVIIYSAQRQNQVYDADQWAIDSTQFGRNIFQILEAQGIQNIRKVADNQKPFVLIFRKNNTDFEVTEIYAERFDEIIEAESIFVGKRSAGMLSSTLVGPASDWQAMEWKNVELEESDEAYVEVYGLANPLGERTLVDSTDMRNIDLRQVDAKQYPYLQLEYHVSDQINRTPPKLDYWRVFHTPLPDAALAPNLDFRFQADSLQRGQSLQMELAVANPTNIPLDSILMKYTLVDDKNNELQYQRRNAPIDGQEKVLTRFELDTETLNGAYKLLIEANPAQEQAERYEFNNIGVKEFVVVGDQRNPLLDVTFDGARIMNGDIVSAKPQIVVNLRDENQFLALNDTSLMKVGVLYPSGEVRRFFFGNQNMTFYPADESNLENNNQARVEFEPIFRENGNYQLQILAEDRSANQSGDYLYTVDFEVITESQISNVFNYPNPFSTSTQFVFTLTGSELPEDLQIQIMTVSGRVIREISMAELGQLRIGNNRTEFRWDGTDQFGDRLANGVYLYRVAVKGAGETEFEKFDNDTDQYFKSGIGKMVIIR